MKKNGFMEGAVIATVAIVFSKLIGLLYVIPFYKIIGDQGGALYGYAYNIYNLFLILSSAGIPLAISKLTSEYVTKKQLKQKSVMFSIARKVILLFSAVSFLICFIFAKPIAHFILGELSKGNTINDVAFVVRCVSFALLIVPVLGVYRGYLQGHKYIAASSSSQVIEQIVRVAIILIGSYLAINIFNLKIKYAVGLSMIAAAAGALFSFFYMAFKTRKIKKTDADCLDKDDLITTKSEIIKKIIEYCVPFIILSLASNLYNTVDMVLLNRGLHVVGFSDIDVETISSVFTTWGNKLTSVVTAIATGLVISLIPTITSARVRNDQNDVNLYFNKLLHVLFFIIMPITIFMSFYATEIWSVFYSENYYGPIIFRFIILVAFFDSANITINSAIQGLNKPKYIYLAVGCGLLTNTLLDYPLILWFSKLGLYPYYGAIVATVIGYTISHFISLFLLWKKEKISYSITLKKMPKYLLSMIIFILSCYLTRLVKFNNTNIIFIILAVGIKAIFVFGIYYLLNFKMINELLKDKFIKRRKKQ